MAQKITQSQTKFVYSTSEQDTGKIWVDGRTVYRKVLQGQVNLINGFTSVAHGISGITTSVLLVSATGSVKIGNANGTSSSTLQTLTYAEGTGSPHMYVTGMDATNLIFKASFAWGSSFYSVVLEYVK